MNDPKDAYELAIAYEDFLRGCGQNVRVTYTGGGWLKVRVPYSIGDGKRVRTSKAKQDLGFA